MSAQDWRTYTRIAENHLAATAPDASALHRLNPLQWRLMAGLCVWLFVLALLVPQAAVSMVQWAIAGAIVAASILRLALLVTPAPPPPRQRWQGPLPVYTVLLPLYREHHQVGPLIAAVNGLDYPRSRLDILLLVEEHDRLTLAEAQRMARAHDHVRVCIVTRGSPRTKPRALNVGLQFARGEFLTIYDAEDRPAPSQLRDALARFAGAGPGLGVVQAPLTWWNWRENWLTRQLEIEYCLQFRVILPALASWQSALPLGGTSNHFRVSALRKVGGWDLFNVTEDADLGFRLARHGWRSAVIDTPTHEEAVTTCTAWLNQRRRWLKGYLQTWLVVMRAPRVFIARAGWRSFATVHLTIAFALASALLHAPFMAWLAVMGIAMASGVIDAIPLSPAFAAVTLTGYLSAFALSGVALWRHQRRGLVAHLLLTPAYWLLHGLAGVLALADWVRRPHHWHKTEHGCTTWPQQREVAACSSLATPPPLSSWSFPSPLPSSPTATPADRPTP